MKTRHLILLVFALTVFGYFALDNKTRAASRLLPFQGRLTDAQGNLIPDGPKLVQFKIYDAPVGGQAVWNGEVQKLTVNGGLVSTLVGTKANLSNVDFDRDLYLELTIDANNDSQITSADPPLLPRQSILPAVFAAEAAIARNSQKLAGQDWAPLFGVNDPSGALLPTKIADGSLPASKLSALSITAAQIAPQTITSNQIGNRAVHLSNLAPQISEALNPPGTIVAFGGPIPPVGWLLCDGSVYNRSSYPALFDAIGTAWGADNSTTFHVPDFRGLFLRGVDIDAGRDPDKNARSASFVGGNTNNNVGSLQSDALRAHRHGITLSHEVSGGKDADGWPAVDGSPPTVYHADTQSDPHVYSDGRGNPIDLFGGPETRPKNAYVHYIIKH